MYAVIETGGKQYRVELGSELAIERLDAAPGETINFERVLLVADGDAAQIGTPMVADALVMGEVLRQDRGEKVIVFKYRPKARHRAKKGHRQEQTVIRVADIRFSGRSAADEATEQEKATAKTRKAASAEAERKAAADQALAAKLAEEASQRVDQETAKESAGKKPAAGSRTKAAVSAAADEAPTETISKAKAPAKAKTAAKPPAKPAAKAAKADVDAKPATGSKTATPKAPRKTATPKAPRKATTKKDE
jgi:large subunit ribosomal protein L21